MGSDSTPDPASQSGPVTPPQSIFAQIQDAALRASVEPFETKISDAQTTLRQGDSRLDALGAGIDPAYTTSDDRFQGMTHQQLYEAVNGVGGLGGLDPKGLQTMRQTWFECASELENLSGFTLMLGMNNIFGHGLWTGGAADAAQTASDRYARVANQIGQVFDSVASRMESAAWAAEAVRKAVQPPPGAVNLVPNVDNPAQAILPGLPNPQLIDQADAEREKARQDAIRALESIYTPSFPPAGANVPSYLDVPKETSGDVSPGPIGPNDTSNGPVSPASGPAPGMGPQPGDPQPGPSDTPPGGGNPSVPSIPQGLVPGGSQDSAATIAAGVGPAADSGLPGAGSAYGPGSGSGGQGAQFGGSGAARAPQPGFAVPGMVPPGGQPGVAARGAVGPQGSSRPGAMPHLPHGRRKEEEEAREHLTPDYLKGVQSEWTEGLDAPVEVIGMDLSAGDEFGGPSTMARGVEPYYPVNQDNRVSAYDQDWFTEHSEVTSTPRSAPSVERDRSAQVEIAAADLVAAAPAPIEPVTSQANGPTAGDTSEDPADDAEPVIIDLSGTGPVIDDEPFPDPKR